jgi:hypothetical protein
MALPEWTLDTSFAEKLHQLRLAVDHILGDDIPPQFRDLSPEEAEQRQRDAGTYVAPGSATPEEVRRAVEVLNAYNQRQSLPFGAAPSEPQQLQPVQSAPPPSDAPANNIGAGNDVVAAPESAVNPTQPVPPPPAQMDPSFDPFANASQLPQPEQGRQAWNPNPLPANKEGANQ